MYKVENLFRLTDHELSGIDIAAVELTCSHGLPGMEGVDIGACLRTFDCWAERARDHVVRMTGLFQRRPEEFNNSWAYFRMLDMVTVLQRDLGVCYNKAATKLDDASFFREPENLFIHGILMGKGGTCSSLPVLFIAVGRRLGYPLKLVSANGHLFARWDEENGERFNIECTSRGLVIHSDEYYRTWPHPLDDAQIRRNGTLKSMRPRQELAAFFVKRGFCFLENDSLRLAVGAFATACNLNPEYSDLLATLAKAMDRWRAQLHERLMPGFPGMTIHFPARSYPSIPKQAEQEIIHLTTKENLLNDRKLQEDYWNPLRRFGQLPASKFLAHIELDFSRNDGTVDIILHKHMPLNLSKNLQPC